MQGLVTGRIVNYVLSEGDVPETHKHVTGAIRPAIVVQVWGEESGCSNLTVFADWSNDGITVAHPHRHETDFTGLSTGNPAREPFPCFWATSRMYSETLLPGTWHWPMDTKRLQAEMEKRILELASSNVRELGTRPSEDLDRIDELIAEGEKPEDLTSSVVVGNTISGNTTINIDNGVVVSVDTPDPEPEK